MANNLTGRQQTDQDGSRQSFSERLVISMYFGLAGIALDFHLVPKGGLALASQNTRKIKWLIAA
jgi:hypothetical protein